MIIPHSLGGGSANMASQQVGASRRQFSFSIAIATP
jgi:hypothetical protein